MRHIVRTLVGDYGLYRIWFEEDKRLILELGSMSSIHLRINISEFWSDVADWKSQSDTASHTEKKGKK